MSKFIVPKKFYREGLKRLFRFIVPDSATVKYIREVTERVPNNKDYYIISDLLGNISDIQRLFERIQKASKARSRVVVVYYNHLWEPILKLASAIGIREPKREQNWLDSKDIENLLYLSNFEAITTQKQTLLPVRLPFVSELLNKWVAHLPVFNQFCLTTYVVARPKPLNKNRNYSVSIIIPARNEEGNIPLIIKSVPSFGKKQEIIFVEGHSNDNTWKAIKKESLKKTRKNLTIKSFRQRGKGKADAVELGFQKATGDILMIYDADRTVDARDLKKFYDALSAGKGEFVNGSRMVYPMEKDAMRILNKLGNRFFSSAFTWILGQRFKDTLCGTKALFKYDYEEMRKDKELFGKGTDPFGDFRLIFGAVKRNLKVVEIPVRYKERSYGSTNINRVRHGLMLLRMTWRAFKKFKAV